MGWQVRKKISFSLMNMRNSKFCGFTTTMDKCHYVMRKVLHNNIDSSRLSQEYDAAKYHSNVGRIEFNRTLSHNLVNSFQCASTRGLHFQKLFINQNCRRKNSLTKKEILTAVQL